MFAFAYVYLLKYYKNTTCDGLQSVRQAQDNNVTLVLIIVVIVFSVCQAPALLNQIFWNVLDDDARVCGGFQFYYSRVSNMLVVTNSAVNFPIYAVFNTRFRQVLTTQVVPCLGRMSSVSSGAGGPTGNTTARRTGYAAMIVDDDPATTFNNRLGTAANGQMRPPPSPIVTSHL